MELVGIVDKNGNPTGVALDKKEAREKNLIYKVIVVFVINDMKQVLFQKRSANLRYMPNRWALCAGHVRASESLEDAAIREAKEEMGINILKEELKSFGEVENNIGESDSHLTYFFYVKTNKKENEFVLQPKEVSEVKWFDIDEIIDMIINKDDRIFYTEKRIKLFEELKKI